MTGFSTSSEGLKFTDRYDDVLFVEYGHNELKGNIYMSIKGESVELTKEQIVFMIQKLVVVVAE